MTMHDCVTFACNTFLDKLTRFLLPSRLVEFLGTTIVKNPIIIWNYWSIVHVFTGVLFFIIWRLFSKKVFFGFIIWNLINLIFEAFEFYFASIGLYQSLFLEEIADIIWDLIMNNIIYFGYYLIKIFIKK